MNKFWSIIGKISVFLTVVWFLVQIYHSFSPGDYKLEAIGDYSYLHLPFAKDKKFGIETIETPQGDVYPYMFTFIVKNVGEKEVTDIKLQLPFDGFYEIISPNMSSPPTESIKFQKNIPVGSLRPSDKLKIEVWSSSSSLGITNDDNLYEFVGKTETKFTHPYGVVRIDYPVKAYGLMGCISRVVIRQGWVMTFFLMVMVLSVCAMIVSLVVLVKKSKLFEKHVEKE